MKTKTQTKSLEQLKTELEEAISFFSSKFKIEIYKSKNISCLDVTPEDNHFSLHLINEIFIFAEENNMTGSIRNNKLSLFI